MPLTCLSLIRLRLVWMNLGWYEFLIAWILWTAFDASSLHVTLLEVINYQGGDGVAGVVRCTMDTWLILTNTKRQGQERGIRRGDSELQSKAPDSRVTIQTS